MNKRINKILFPTLMWLIPITVAVYGYGLGVHSLTNYIYKTYSEPFLENQVIATHLQKKLATTIQTSQIEYQVLKVQGSKTTAVKK
jgi:hypothetical protein